MQLEANNISQTPSEEIRYSSGIGYVAVPKESLISRREYILDCYKNGWVTIFIEGEGLKQRVLCDTDCFNWIYFPKDYKQVGTPVVWVFDKLQGNIYITSTLTGGGNYEHGEENGFRLVRKLGSNFVEISGNSEKNYLNLVVHSDTGSSLDIGVTDPKEKSKLNISVSGDSTIRTTGTTQFINHKKFSSLVEDPKDELIRSFSEIFKDKINDSTFSYFIEAFEQYVLRVGGKKERSKKKVSILDIKPENITVKTDKFRINNGVEKMVLGDTLKELLDEIIKEVSEIQVISPMGLTPIFNKAQILSLSLKTSKILSRHGYLN